MKEVKRKLRALYWKHAGRRARQRRRDEVNEEFRRGNCWRVEPCQYFADQPN